MVALVLALMTTGSGMRRHGVRVLVPVGRSVVVGPNQFEATIDGEPWTGTVLADGHGGYWLDIDPVAKEGSTLVLRLVVAGPAPTAVGQELGVHDWLASSALIDSSEAAIASTAASIAGHERSATGKAHAIHEYVASNLDWRRYPGHKDDPASTTLELGYGTCGGLARLFVALSRAVGVPARTVQGVVFDNSTSDAYHQWAEYRDEMGIWRPVDPTTKRGSATDSRTYLDLISAAEENPFWSDPDLAIVYDATPRKGSLGYRMIDTTASTRTLENIYEL